MNKKWTKTFTNRCTKLRECTVWTVYDLANNKGLLVKEKKCSVDEKCETFSVRLCLRMLGKLMLANFGLKIRPFKESNLKNFSQIKRLMAWTIYCTPVRKGAATDGLATPHRLRRSVELRTPPDFSVNPSIPLFEHCLKKKLNVPLVKIFLLQTFIRNRVSSFKNLEGKSKIRDY